MKTRWGTMRFSICLDYIGVEYNDTLKMVCSHRQEKAYNEEVQLMYVIENGGIRLCLRSVPLM
jgi:hypothetical protein